jgi:uncharacterized UPF0160 family protein
MKIGTHSGHFHADEALACFFLKSLPEYAEASIVRSRDLKVLDQCDIVVDVGARFEPENKRFDHHQREFSETMESLKILKFKTKLSSAGLVYAYYGKAVISQLTGIAKDTPKMELLYEKLYEKFVEEFDGIDNGVNQYEGEAKYSINSTISSRVGALNPRWNDEDKSEARENSQFEKAVALVGAEFAEKVDYYIKSWLPAYDIVKSAVENRKENDPEGRLVIFENSGCPWKEHLFTIEKQLNIEGNILYVIYKNKPTDWRIQCVPVSSSSFTNRKSLPENWRGVRDEKLATVSTVADATFCHASGFIGGAATQSGVMQMAKLSLA